LACEVKKTVAELDQLVELIQRFSTDRDAADALKSSREKTPFGKKASGKARFYFLGGRAKRVPIRYFEIRWAFAAIQAARRSRDATRSMLARVWTREILRVKRFATRLTRTTLAKEVL
jgi:hypothetical protein